MKPIVVIGGGIAGLAAASRLAKRTDVVLVEKSPRLGGKISTERADGFVFEGGPDCFLAAKPAGLALCREIGIADRVAGANPATRATFVVRGGKLHPLPEGLTGLVPSKIGPLMTTRLLSVAGRLRAALELVVPPFKGEADESLAAFVGRRFGDETWQWLVEPLLAGIYAGDGRALSLLSTFPQLRDLERRHGSIVRSMLQARVAPKPAAKAPNGFVTLPGGMAEIVEAVGRTLPASSLRLGCSVASLARREHEWTVRLDDGSEIDASALVIAVPASAAASLLAPVDAVLAAELAAIPFVSVATVSVAFDSGSVAGRLPGWGYVRPRAEYEGGDASHDVVACTVTSQKFPARTPDGALLFRFFLGRAGREGLATADDATIQQAIRAELKRMMGISAEPVQWRIRRWPAAIPQYVMGHPQRVARIEARVARLSGLALAGASYKGVGVPDCIQNGWDAADALTSAASASRARARHAAMAAV